MTREIFDLHGSEVARNTCNSCDFSGKYGVPHAADEKDLQPLCDKLERKLLTHDEVMDVI
jgi:cytochrome c5